GLFHRRWSPPHEARRVGRPATSRSTWPGLRVADRTARRSSALPWPDPGGTGVRAGPAFCGPERPRVLVRQSVDGHGAPYEHGSARWWLHAHWTSWGRWHPREARYEPA